MLVFFFCFRLSNFNHHSLAAPAVTTSVMPHSMEKDCVVLRIEKFHSCRVFVSLFFLLSYTFIFVPNFVCFSRNFALPCTFFFPQSSIQYFVIFFFIIIISILIVISLFYAFLSFPSDYTRYECVYVVMLWAGVFNNPRRFS